MSCRRLVVLVERDAEGRRERRRVDGGDHLVRRADEAAERRGVIARCERLHVREVRLERGWGYS